MAEANCDWKKSVQEKLISIFGKDAETLTRIFFYLDEEDKVYYNNRDDTIPPVWRTLKLTASKDDVFKKYAERLADDTKKAEKDEAFRTTMNVFYTQIMEPLDEPAPDDLGQEFDMVRLADLSVAKKSAFMGLSRAWVMIPETTQAAMLEIIPKIISNKQLVSCVDEVVGLVNKAGSSIVMVGLAALQLGYDAIDNLRRWWNGEISGKRCSKNIIDSFCTITAGIGGGIGGVMLGSLVAGPVGMVVGGVVGGIASSAAMNVLSDRLTQLLFGIPKSEALENAYTYLGVPMSASNNEINSAFHKLCLKHHPDKGGDTKEFLILQLNMGTIKAAKGQL